jgi:hypothetical protein
MANAWGLPDNEVKQIKSGLGIADVSAAPVKPVRRKAAAIPGIGDTPDMKPYRFMNAQELANEGAGPVKSLVGGFSGSIANAIAGDKEGKLYEYTSPEAQNRVEGEKISNYMAGSLGQVKGRRTVIPGIASVAEAADLPVKTSAAVPTDLSNIAANAVVGAAGGNPTISTALEKVGGDLAVSPATSTAASTVPAIGDPGSGSALVSGKKINYQDIGGIGDPLKSGHDGSGRIKGQAQNSNSLVGNLIDRRDQGIVSQEYKDQVANAVRINAANGMAPTAEQMKTLGMTNTDLVNVLAANNKDGRYDTQITDLQKQQFVDQQGQKLAVDSQALENDLAYKNNLLAIDAPLKDAQAKQYLSEAKKNDLMSTPEYLKAAGKDKSDEQRYKLMEKLIGTNESLYGKILDGIRQHPEGMNLPVADQEKFARDKAWEATLQSFSNVGGLFASKPEEGGARSGPNKTLQGAVVALRAAQEGIEKRKAAGQIDEKQANAEFRQAWDAYAKVKSAA